MNMSDEGYMRLAVGLAKRAEGLANPNPTVGAIIAKDGKIVGRGYHRRCGLAHAEVCAINLAGDRARSATLYVTLEPCDHFGRTPPCTDAIIRSGVRRVVIAMKDPNPVNNGRGIKRLKSRGIETTVGIMGPEARSLNRPYIKYITEGMPYVTVKVAESIDGKIATRTGESRWITSGDSRQYVRRLRARVDAVMVGANTVLKDDPLLMGAAAAGRRLLRVIVDSNLKTPLTAKIFSNLSISQVIIATVKRSLNKKAMLYEDRGAKVLLLKSKGGRVDLRHLLKALAKMEVLHVLVEGGGELIGSLVEEDLVDRFLFFIAPKIIGGRGAVTAVEGVGVARIREAADLKNMTIRRFKRDILIEAEVV